jgi:hypothetical protein
MWNMATHSVETEKSNSQYGLRWWQITPLVLLSVLVGVFQAQSLGIAVGTGTTIGTMVGFVILASVGIFGYNVLKSSNTTTEPVMTARMWKLVVFSSTLLTAAMIPLVFASVGSVIVGIFAMVFLTLSILAYLLKVVYLKVA